MANGEAELFTQLRELHTALHTHGITYCVIGGVAVNAHGAVRATHDLDLMLSIGDIAKAHEIVTQLGYITIDSGGEITSYVRDHTRLDLLLAQRPQTQELLARAQTIYFGGTMITVVPLEGLLGLKIQAFNDDPRRLKDLQDIIDLVGLHHYTLNLDEVRAYFRLFDREKVLDDVIASLGIAGAGRA